jgi:LETM1 and EF-hand domain-containing protein 1
MHSIKNDDTMIQAEGVESLSDEELRHACRERGHLDLLSIEEMRHQVCLFENCWWHTCGLS